MDLETDQRRAELWIGKAGEGHNTNERSHDGEDVRITSVCGLLHVVRLSDELLCVCIL
jgi:hypothetical protein